MHNMVLFGRLLRGAGLDVNPGRMIDLVQALQYVEVGRRRDFYYTARSLLVHNHEDLPLFDHAFDLFWRKRGTDNFPVPPPLVDDEPPQDLVTTAPVEESGEAEIVGAEEGDEELPLLIELTATYSQRELLRKKDFSDLTAGEEEAIKHFMAEMAWNLGQRRTRRKRSGHGRQPDWRRGFRRNMRYGGEPLEWPTRRPKVKPRPLVIIADISGSMERYTRLLLHFIYGVTVSLEQPVEAFVFSTALTRITRQLRRNSIEYALAEVSTTVHDWAGGTRIGESLKNFNYDWARRVLGRGAIVLLISDGWDRGDPQILQIEMRRLQRSCYRLIWLNPLLGSSRYEPLTRGMQAALPSVDDFLPVHNLARLEDLAKHLAQLLDEKQQISRQQVGLGGSAFVGRR
jgi:uncharacterized protein with von Willebrand factor type A (vWA) domain